MALVFVVLVVACRFSTRTYFVQGKKLTILKLTAANGMSFQFADWKIFFR